MLRSAARSKGTWVAMLVTLVLGSAPLVILTSPGSHPKPAQAQTTQDPLAVAKASLVADNIEIASFNDVQEITSSIKLPRAEGSAAQLEPIRIVLRRPANGDLDVSAWHRKATTHATGYRHNATLTLYNIEGTPTMKFHLQHAWPSGYHIDSVKTGSSSILYERVTLTAGSFQRVDPSSAS